MEESSLAEKPKIMIIASDLGDEVSPVNPDQLHAIGERNLRPPGSAPCPGILQGDAERVTRDPDGS